MTQTATRTPTTTRPPVTVLVAEDDVLVARDIEETLGELGYEVASVVGSGREAVEAARAERPDFALLDIRMPGELDGVDAGRVLIGELDVPVVYLTAYGDDATLERALEVRPYGYVVKPFDPRELHSTLQVAMERKKVEDRLDASERRLAATLRSIGEAVVTTDEEGRVRSLNPSAEALLGIVALEAVGRPVESLTRFRGADGTATPHPVLRALSEGRVVELAEGSVLEGPNGEVTPVSDSAAPILTDQGQLAGSVLVVRDDSASRGRARALRESEARLRQLAEHIEDVFWISSPDKGRIDYVSPAYESIWGRPIEELLEEPHTWFDQVHPEDRAKVQEAIPRQSEPRGYEVRYRIIRPDGEIRWIWDRAFPVTDDHDRVTRIVGVAEDVTRRVTMERRMAQGQRLEAVGQLAGGVAHDFNNLLTVVRAQVELVLDELDEGSPHREELEIIGASAARGAGMTRKLLAFSRDQMLRPQPLDVASIIEDMGQFLDRLLGDSVQVRYRLADDLPAVEIDPGQLERVVMNLAVNGRDAMPEGGTLSLSARLETLGPEDVRELPELQPGRYVALEVADTGIGMDARVMDRMFNPFFTTKAAGKGTGLGLAMVFGIVKQSGGFIHVESTPGQGSRFVLRFPPVDAPPVAESQKRRGSGDAKQATSGESYDVVLVEDDPSVGRVTRKILERAGHRVRLFSDAEAALDALQTGDPPTVLISDMGLPGLSGPAFLERLQATQPDLHVIAISGYARGSLESGEALPEDVVFLPKPFTPDELLAVLSRAARHPSS